MLDSKISLIALAAATVAVPASAETTAVDTETWQLADLYPDKALWDASRAELETEIEALAAYAGRLGEKRGAVLREFLDLRYALRRKLGRVYSYASNGASSDTRDAEAQSRRLVASTLYTKLAETTAFVDPELLSLGAGAVRRMMKQEKGLATYRFPLEEVLRSAANTLDEQGEGLLASAGELRRGPFSAYRILANADMPWPSVTLADGAEVELNQAAYQTRRSSPVRADRELVFNTYFDGWNRFEATAGALLDAQVRADRFDATARGYPSSLAASLAPNALPEGVYRTLVAETNAALPTLHRYLRLRGRMLDIEDLAYHDIYAPMVASDETYPIERGKQLSLDSAAPLGEEYVATMKRGFDERWMDTYPRPGKSSGAYMSGGAHDVHPYVLMNYSDDYDSVSTLAHEWGHALHTVLSREQPYHLSRYATFIAEIASTFNESLLLDHVLTQAADDDERLFYLGKALDQLRGTYFRQTQFAEFELWMHEELAAGRPLTGARLTEQYGELLRRYHGHDDGVMTIDPRHTVEWTIVPHFYFGFYVFQYATSIAAASLLAEEVVAALAEGDTEPRDRYLTLLGAGGSDHPHELLLKAGVDLTTPEPYRALARRMDKIMDEIEAILDRR
jgi:oligoendopeptidase F